MAGVDKTGNKYFTKKEEIDGVSKWVSISSLSFPPFVLLSFIIVLYASVFIGLIGFIMVWDFGFIYIDFDLYELLVLSCLYMRKGCFCMAMISSLQILYSYEIPDVLSFFFVDII